ncbi:HAD-IIA family hydrolase [uncultured Campylobacter sp.]|uniref:HAD-IIA family hydrolase n=1 Tax=uncultured Campylobacter sp. TaxID=218934 RepID=UPI0026334CC4|nr:HAD-IIA family hydrolase [uncultured Campylobacter sp.]
MLFLDVQGTLLSDEDKSLIKGSKELIEHLNLNNIPYVIITNNTKNLSLLKDLRLAGLDIKENAYLDPFCVLSYKIKPCKVAAYGANAFLQSLQSLGYKLEYKKPEAVLIASYDNFSFDDFASMIEFANLEIKIIAMHETSIYKKNSRSYPGVGSIMAMLHYATNCKYEVVGKPSKAFYEQALTLLQKQNKNAKFSDVLIISDDFKGDLLKAKDIGMKTALVLSGKIKSTANLDTNKLDFVYSSVNDYLKEIQ